VLSGRPKAIGYGLQFEVWPHKSRQTAAFPGIMASPP
jgi:hypothetical protein